MMNPHILIVDDEKEICELIEIYLKHEDYITSILHDGMKVVPFLNDHKVQLIILDIMLPHIDGITLCKTIREISDVPIIMLSAKREDHDRILGIVTGADDYIAKPFNPLEVVVRVQAQLRRYLKPQISVDATTILIQDIVIKMASHEVLIKDNHIVLTATEFDILVLLATHKEQVFSSKMIYESVWKEAFYGAENIIMTHIRNLRDQLGDSVKQQKYIKTIWGVGYKIES